jgi:glycosyltransferase involved in cell wall biosynthesis
MFSIIIPTHNNERLLVATLIALVPGAAAGLVREVIVADRGSQDATLRVAESAGCEIVIADDELGSRLKAAADKARASWLMFLRAGCVLDATWLEECERFLQQTGTIDLARQPAAVFRPAPRIGTRRPLLVEALSLLRVSLGGRPRPQQGLIVSKPRYDHLGGHDVVARDTERDLLTRLGQIVVLRSSATMAG